MLGTIVSMVGTAYAANQNKNAQNEANMKRTSNLASYESAVRNRLNREKYTDSTQLADQSAAISTGIEGMRRSNRAAEGRNAVLGGSNSAVAAAKEASNNVMGSTVRNIAAAGQARQQAISAREDTLDNNVRTAQDKIYGDTLTAKLANNKMVAKGFETAGNGLETAENKAADYFIDEYLK